DRHLAPDERQHVAGHPVEVGGYEAGLLRKLARDAGDYVDPAVAHVLVVDDAAWRVNAPGADLSRPLPAVQQETVGGPDDRRAERLADAVLGRAGKRAPVEQRLEVRPEQRAGERAAIYGVVAHEVDGPVEELRDLGCPLFPVAGNRVGFELHERPL